jgi:serine/threonine protein kinase
MLGDMGLARRIKRKKGDFNSKYIPRYNALYAAPELNQRQRYTKACDVFCFGICLWEMSLVRKWSENELARGHAACLVELQDIFPMFGRIVSQCWHEDPPFRPTFAELLEEFSKFTHQEISSYREMESFSEGSFFDDE